MNVRGWRNETPQFVLPCHDVVTYRLFFPSLTSETDGSSALQSENVIARVRPGAVTVIPATFWAVVSPSRALRSALVQFMMSLLMTVEPLPTVCAAGRKGLCLPYSFPVFPTTPFSTISRPVLGVYRLIWSTIYCYHNVSI